MFIPKFTIVRGFKDRYLLFLYVYFTYEDVNTLVQRGYSFGGIVGCTMHHLPKTYHGAFWITNFAKIEIFYVLTYPICLKFWGYTLLLFFELPQNKMQGFVKNRKCETMVLLRIVLYRCLWPPGAHSKSSPSLYISGVMPDALYFVEIEGEMPFISPPPPWYHWI